MESAMICVPCNFKNIMEKGENQSCYLLRQPKTPDGRCSKCQALLLQSTGPVSRWINEWATSFGRWKDLDGLEECQQEKFTSDHLAEINGHVKILRKELETVKHHAAATELLIRNFFQCVADIAGHTGTFMKDIQKAFRMDLNKEEITKDQVKESIKRWKKFVGLPTEENKASGVMSQNEFNNAIHKEEKESCWEAMPVQQGSGRNGKMEYETVGYKVRWSEPMADGSYLSVGHYLWNKELGPSLEWCKQAAEHQAERMNAKNKHPWEYSGWKPTKEQNLDALEAILAKDLKEKN